MGRSGEKLWKKLKYRRKGRKQEVGGAGVRRKGEKGFNIKEREVYPLISEGVFKRGQRMRYIRKRERGV